jgi:hypothetical protein
MVHDTSGKATVLSIMNELHSNEMIQKEIDDLISFILNHRKIISKEEVSLKSVKWIKYINGFLDDIAVKSKNICNFTQDQDIYNAIISLINVAIAYKNLINNHYNQDIIHKLAKEKNIIIKSELQPLDLFTGLLLVMKETCTIECKEDAIDLYNMNYNFLKQENGVLNFLYEKYDIISDFLLNTNNLRIIWKLKTSQKIKRI